MLSERDDNLDVLTKVFIDLTACTPALVETPGCAQLTDELTEELLRGENSEERVALAAIFEQLGACAHILAADESVCQSVIEYVQALQKTAWLDSK